MAAIKILVKIISISIKTNLKISCEEQTNFNYFSNSIIK